MSTLSGVHGHSEGTRVPRRTLVTALKRRTVERLFTPDGLVADQPFIDVAAPASGWDRFALQ